jgi:2,4-dienoyl-CoA reductase-like NADH-dependent reductase (Old Yellow Enzyme family)
LENYNNAVLDINNPWDAVEAFRPACQAAKSRGAIFLPQLQFPGRQVPEFLNANPKSSSSEQLDPCLNKTYGKPSPLTRAEIKDLQNRYVWAAEVLFKAGADGIIVSFADSSGLFERMRLTIAAACESRVYHATVPITLDQQAN